MVNLNSVKSVGFSKYNNKSVVDVIHQYKGILQNGYCLNFMQVDLTYVQELFNPVAFSNGSKRDAEALTFINFIRLLNEAEGISSLLLTFIYNNI